MIFQYVENCHYWPHVEFQALYPLIFPSGFSLSWVAWSHACTNQFSAQYLRRICRSLESYLNTTFLSLVLWSVKPSHLALSGFSVSSPQLAETDRFCVFPSSHCGLGTSTRQWAGSVVGLTFFVSHLLGISVSLTDVQCLKNYCFTYFVWICCCCCKWEGNQSLSLHLDWKWKVLKLQFKINFFLHDHLEYIL